MKFIERLLINNPAVALAKQLLPLVCSFCGPSILSLLLHVMLRRLLSSMLSLLNPVTNSKLPSGY